MFTLKDFLALDCIYDPKLMTAIANTQAIAIEYISVIEIPVDNFIRKKELVLTTALGCYDNKDLFLEFVREIYESGAAALVICIKSNDFTLPQNILDFAEQHRFPVVMIPWECRFAEIMEEVITRLKNENLKMIRHYEAMQKELLHHYLNAASLAEAGSIIAKFLKCSAVITDKDYVSKKLPPGRAGHGADHGTIINPKDYSQKIIIQGNGKIYGYLLLNFPDEQEKNITELESIEKYVLMPLLLWFNKEDIISTTKESLKNDFVWDLAAGRFSNREDIQLKGALFGFNLNVPYTCIISSLRNPDNAEYNMAIEHSGTKKREALESLLLNLAKRTGKQVMFTIRRNIIVIYLENTMQNPEKNIFAFIDALEEKLLNLFPGYSPYWGTSEIKLSETDFHTYYKNANFALNICINGDALSRRGTYEDTDIFKMLTVLSNSDQARKISLGVLQPLIDHDNNNKLNLMHTLKAHLNNNYNVCKTAKALHLHRQSLLYRLSKIEELTGMSLNNHNELFLFELCIRLYLSYSQKLAFHL